MRRILYMEKARNLVAPQKAVVLDGQRYELRFDNKAAMIAEDVYGDEYGKDIGYLKILEDMAKMKHRAVMAMVYAGMVSAGAQMPFSEFEKKFSYSAIAGVREAVMKALADYLPEGDEKN